MRKYVILFSLILFAGIVTISPAATWTIDKITDNTEPDGFSFATRVQSGLTVVYTHNDGDFETFTASNTSGSWTTSRITDNTRADYGLDIASRPGDNNVHIALQWQDTPDGEISYCTGNPTSGWDIERVTDDPDNDAWPSIEVDASGFAHIVYQKDTGGDLEIFYSNNVTGHWVSEQVTDNATPDQVPWMDLDSDGNPHIVYTDGSMLFYTKKTAGIWTTPEPILGGFGANSLPFLVLDNADNAHICFAKDDGTDNEIYYANNVTGDWQESKVTSNDYPDAYPTLFVDQAKKAHIAYLAGEAADIEVFYANNVGGVWDIGRVTDNSLDDFALLGQYFIPDAQGHGNIFFWNNSDGDAEIYVARTNEKIASGIEETTPVPAIAISLDQGVFASSTVNYSVPRAGNISLKVYDASGCLVKTLVDGVQSEGEYTVTWNALTDAGVHAAPGVYFYRLVAGGETASVKGILK
ncbi:T9SS type A sorting domain-containing protein [candidate division WOR-3 bacterium]|nr:T9SS type A sorting domain-containing protein [candidate division WOR-3 bacterium]